MYYKSKNNISDENIDLIRVFLEADFPFIELYF
jgi:hypothetical protein